MMNDERPIRHSSFIVSSQFLERPRDLLVPPLEDGSKIEEHAIVFDAGKDGRRVAPQARREIARGETLMGHRH